MDTGKQFEDEFKQSCLKRGVTVIRMRDQMSRNSLSNPGDFFAYKFPNGAVVECKTSQTSIPKTQILGKKGKDGNYKMSQLNEILKVNGTEGFYKLYLIRLAKYGLLFTVTAEEMHRWFVEEGNASIKKSDLDEGRLEFHYLPYTLKRTRYDIHVEKIFEIRQG